MQSPPRHLEETEKALLERIDEDPWSLNFEQRQRVVAMLPEAQDYWLARLPGLVEPPAPGPGFPACLLACARFADLREAIGAATRRSELATATADELQRFVDLFSLWLRVLDPAPSFD
jgi:hypothetical protein